MDWEGIDSEILPNETDYYCKLVCSHSVKCDTAAAFLSIFIIIVFIFSGYFMETFIHIVFWNDFTLQKWLFWNPKTDEPAYPFRPDHVGPISSCLFCLAFACWLLIVFTSSLWFVSKEVEFVRFGSTPHFDPSLWVRLSRELPSSLPQ